MPSRILFLDNPPRSDISPLVEAINKTLEESCDVLSIYSPADLEKSIQAHGRPDLVFVDDLFQRDDLKSGTALLKDLLQLLTDVPVVVILNISNKGRTGEILEAGATDVLIRDQDLHEKLQYQMRKVKRIIGLIKHNRDLSEQNRTLIQREVDRYQMIGSCQEMTHIFEKIKRIAQIPRPVLITGERGTGKELVARAIHHCSVGFVKPLVVVNCAAFSDQLLESELFGHEKGAFTDADRQYIGKFEQADQGTLFLDEIGNMSLSFQKKIMRIVEYGTFRRVGGNKEIRINTRIVTATNANLKKLIEEGKFLPDLYDRLAFEEIHLPALRDRKGDIEVLANFFLQKFMEEVPAFQGKKLSSSAIRQLNRYHFPGNIRELKNIIERSVYRDTTNEITPEDIGFLSCENHQAGSGSFKDKIESYELELVQQALQDADGNQAGAARMLGLSYHQLRYYLKKYGLS